MSVTKTRIWPLPIFQGLLPVTKSQVMSEVIAGITLAALAIPEVMGYTKIAGTPVITGLYTLLIPTALFAIFGSSRHLVVGADSATAAILAAGLAGLASTGSAAYMAFAGVSAFIAGGFLFLARIIGLGFLADFLSRTVLVGFLTGVGIQVALGEITGMLGLKGGGHGTLGKIITDLQQIDYINWYAVAISMIVLAVTVGCKRISRKVPGALIAVIGATAASWALNLEALGVQVVGAVPSGLPHIGLPQVVWNVGLIEKLAPTAFAMFVVILAQSAATSRAYAVRYNERFSEDTDMVGLGLANLGAGLSGTFVVNGSPTKTQMVDSAGGRTQLSQIMTVIIVLVVLLFLTRPLAYMPEAVLASVVFLIGVDLIDIGGMRRIYFQRRVEFWVAVITTATVVLVGVEQGILLAIVLSLLAHTRHGYRPKNCVLVAAEKGGWRPQPVTTNMQVVPGLLVYHFSHSIYYANAGVFSSQVTELVENAEPPLKWFCIEASAVDDVDYSAAETLRSVHGFLQEKGVRLVFAHLMEDLKTKIYCDLAEQVSKVAFYDSIEEILQAYRQSTGTVTGEKQQKQL